MNKQNIKRIGIDARFYGPSGKGLGRYTQEVVDRILSLDKDNEYVVFLSRDNFHSFATANPKVRKVQANFRWYSWAEQFLMPYLIWKEKLDFVHFMHFNIPLFCPSKFIVTIHDLILTRFPSRRASTLAPVFYVIKNLGYRIAIKWAVYRAEKIITVSNFTKSDITSYFHISDNSALAAKIVVAYEGVASGIANTENQDDKQVVLSYNIHNRYLLYVGNAYPHKNLEELINVFSIIKEKYTDLQLVLVGKEDYFYERLRKYVNDLKPDVGKDIIFPGYVPDSNLKILYKEALAYVFPSLYEGFGLPPLEAMANSCPVISSKTSSMPEVLGEAASYFNPNDRKDMVDKLERIITDDQLRADLIKKGMQQVQKYSWDNCASQIFSIYKQV